MYAKGMTTRDISSHIKKIYVFALSESMVSKITNKVLLTVDEVISFNKDDYYMKRSVDIDNRILRISDTEMGMTEEELETNPKITTNSGFFALKKLT